MFNIPKLIEAETNCLTGSATLCRKCPYWEDEECVKHLIDDLTAALKRLQFLEKPTPEEQPELPGIPHVAYVILSSESQNNNNDVEVYGIYTNEHETAELVNSLNLLNEERYWYQKSLLE